MKQRFRYISVLMMLFVGTIASAQSTIKVMPVTNGTVTVDKNSASWGDEVTITVTPDEGYYFQKENLEVVKTVNPNFSLTRGEIPLSRNLTVGGDDPYDLSLARIYSLSIFDD